MTSRDSGPAFIFRALRHRNFALFFSGQGISLMGTWMQQIGMSWLVYRLTGSAWLLGVVGFCSQFPTFFLSSFAGVLADRLDRRRIVMTTQTAAMLQASVLAFLTLTGQIHVWHLIVLGLVLGTINAVDIPARQAFMFDMVIEKDDLSNAIALNSSLVQCARLIGPAIGGLVIGAYGEGVCFLLNALSFVAVLASLIAMRLDQKRPHQREGSVWEVWKEGLVYVTGFVPVRLLLGLLGLMSLTVMPYSVLLPVFSTQVLHGGPHTLGFLMATSGFGALAGALTLASRRSVLGLVRVIAAATVLVAIGLMAFSLSRVLWVSHVILFLLGFGAITAMASSNTVIQTIVADDKRGRVMSFFAMAFMGMAPIGSLLAGALADRFGAPATLFGGGLICLAGALVFVSRLHTIRAVIRPIYQQMGILPPVPPA